MYDASDYLRFRKLATKNKNYNDLTYGGDKHFAGQTALKLGGFSGAALAQGQVITYYDTSGNQLASGTIAAVDGGKIFINGKSLGFRQVLKSR